MAAVQGGDAFDLSNVLVSLLIGVGYDAYMVMGYASPAVVMCDHSQVGCHDFIHSLLKNPDAALSKARSRPEERKKPSKYAAKSQNAPNLLARALQQVRNWISTRSIFVGRMCKSHVQELR